MFLRKIKDAVPSASDQACDLEQLTDSLPPEAVAEWKAMVERWEEDNSNVNPFEVKVKGACLILRCTFGIHLTNRHA
jgi:hypothetical protein